MTKRPLGARLVMIALLMAVLAPRLDADATQYVGQPIASVRVTANGQELHDPEVLSLLQTRAGDRLTYDRMRETIAHLYGLGRYAEVRVDAVSGKGGLDLTYVLIGLHAIARVEYGGRLALSEGKIARAVKNAFAGPPSLDRIEEAVRAVRNLYADNGYLAAKIVPDVKYGAKADENRLTFDIQPGPQARIAAVNVIGMPLASRQAFLAGLGIAPGAPYLRAELETRVSDIERQYRDRGYYEAHIGLRDIPSRDFATVDLEVSVEPGPGVTIEQAGDPLPADELAALVPVRREASVDQDLLEDSMHQIEQRLSDQGYWKARAQYTSMPSPEGRTLRIVIDIRRGRRYFVRGVEITGNHAFDVTKLRTLMRTTEGTPFSDRQFSTDLEVLRDFYRRNGFAAAKAEGDPVEAPGAPAGVLARARIDEGPRTIVEAVRFEGSAQVPIEQLGVTLRTRRGEPYYPPDLRIDRDHLLLEYLKRGYQNVSIDPVPTLDPATRTRATVTFQIHEGDQVLVNHVIVAGNTRTKRRIIDRELALKPGGPLGLEQTIESQRRLSSLGIFRRVRITELKGGEDPRRRDVLVVVEEAPATTIAYGAGLEAGRRLRLETDTGAIVATERIDVAPRGSFEVTRRNLWGKNRSIDFFTRASVRPTDKESGRFGLSEYRLLATYREPRLFNWPIDGVLTGVGEQGIRSSFSFRRRGLSVQAARRFRGAVSVAARYAFQETRLFNQRIPPNDQLNIDRLFPSVRLSSFSTSVIRDSRDDAVEPRQGTLLAFDGELAARRVGSEIGFAKSFLQAYHFRRTLWRGSVIALGARLGLAHGFERRKSSTGQIVDDLPASERFFAGGSTTVRGFGLDRLGAPATLDPRGVPKGGNAMAIFNAELRIPLRGPFGVVTFVDAGNVFARTSDLRLGDLRAAPGFGLRYRSPVGPVRVDFGFNLDRRRLGTTGDLEKSMYWYVSIGHAF